MSVSNYTIRHLILSIWVDPSAKSLNNSSRLSFDALRPLRQWLERIEVKNSQFAHFLCRSIPAQCPFSRILRVRDRILLTIPPLCKLNPLYDELMMLRFRAICYLADECHEDVSQYC